MKLQILGAIMLLVAFGVCGCKVIEQQAKSKVDESAGQAVTTALEFKDPGLAATIRAEAESRAAAGESWPWVRTVAEHWEAIAIALGGVGVIVERFRTVRRLVREKNYAGVSAEVLSFVVEKLKSTTPDVSKLLQEQAAAHPAVNGKSIREMIAAAGFKPA